MHQCRNARHAAAVCAFAHFCIWAFLLVHAPLHAQTIPLARVNVLLAEDRRAPTPRDLTTLQVAARGTDALTARLAVRALGRLERPAVLPSILPALRHRLPENRAEAANAAAQAAQGWKTAKPVSGTVTPGSLLTTLISNLEGEPEPGVRAAICESIGRLPFRDGGEVARAESALLDQARRTHTVTDRLGVVKGLEALVRLQSASRPPSARAIAVLKAFTGLPAADDLVGDLPAPLVGDLRDARVRRLAIEALTTAGAIDAELLERGTSDTDVQVRRLAVRAASTARIAYDQIVSALEDPAGMVRLEAVRALRSSGGDEACAFLLGLLDDVDTSVVLLALDELGGCGSSPDAVARLEATANDLSTAGAPRGWHRSAHAIVALAAASPDRAAAAIGQFTASRVWQLRTYAARAAAALKNRSLLETLAGDLDDNVVEAAIYGLITVSGHASDAVYLAALSRSGYQAIRAAAQALKGAPESASVVPALRAALERLTTEGRANSTDARTALIETLTTLGAAPTPPKGPARSTTQVSADNLLRGPELRRLAAPRARVTIADVGTFDLALFTSEAPATVLRFAQLAESGFYNGLTFHRVVPNLIIQGGSPGANEFIGQADHMRDEVGLWPHVRGAVGISTRGRDTGDAQIFIDLVDSPRFDHEYTVFAQVLNGIDVVDRILEGDVIQRIEIIP
jgi:cyclophilin family peptidyl-prolyl cis-trans isomerase